MFSRQPAADAPMDPSAVTHRYGATCAKLGIDSHLHALRHYSATELLTAGVDLRTAAGRLGRGGGGATTLRAYAVWVGAADRRAASCRSSYWMTKRVAPREPINSAFGAPSSQVTTPTVAR